MTGHGAAIMCAHMERSKGKQCVINYVKIEYIVQFKQTKQTKTLPNSDLSNTY